MSAITGIFYFDREQFDINVLNKVIDDKILSDRGQNARDVWVNGVVGLAHRAFWTTTEQEIERQPFHDKNTGLTLVMDGRIDNRNELSSELKSCGIKAELITDASIVLYSYFLWKEACLKKIIGDFAFAIWDSKNNQLFCARDIIGVRPFYFYKCERFLAFASDAIPLFKHPDIPKEPDLDSMALYLTNNFENSERTEFKNIFKLRPAHCMTVKKDDFKIRQYWDINLNYTNEFKKIEDYTEAFMEVFTKSMISKLRLNSEPGITLSGGLDSSSVLALIDDLKSKKKTNVETSGYSAVFDTKPADESDFINIVQKKYKIKSNRINSHAPKPLWEVPDAIHASQALWSVEGIILTKPVYDLAKNEGRKVIFTGEGGDDYIDASMYLATDLLFTGKFAQGLAFIDAYSQYQLASYPLVLKLVLSMSLNSLRSMLPRWFKKLYRTIRPIKTYDWINQPHRENLFQRLREEPWYLKNKKFKTISRKETYSSLFNGYRVSGFELLDRLAASSNTVELRHPLCDRRIIEFVSSVPEEMLVYGWKPKGFLRESMKQLLPVEIKNRMDKADFTSLINKLLIYENHNEVKELLNDSYLHQIGLIDKGKVLDSYEQYCQKYANNLDDSTWSDIMWQIISLEYWARNNFGRIISHRGTEKYGKQVKI
ncbi:MAG: hypothetical protein HY094_01240 [Candidatus Melainabacteria bacterium]|nr:hypothetical protein [Candidatus Melainabacteria bacterium]